MSDLIKINIGSLNFLHDEEVHDKFETDYLIRIYLCGVLKCLKDRHPSWTTYIPERSLLVNDFSNTDEMIDIYNKYKGLNVFIGYQVDDKYNQDNSFCFYVSPIEFDDIGFGLVPKFVLLVNFNDSAYHYANSVNDYLQFNVRHNNNNLICEITNGVDKYEMGTRNIQEWPKDTYERHFKPDYKYYFSDFMIENMVHAIEYKLLQIFRNAIIDFNI
jgi:hypothetical protein